MTALLNTRLTKGSVLFQGHRENLYLLNKRFVYLLICIYILGFIVPIGFLAQGVSERNGKI